MGLIQCLHLAANSQEIQRAGESVVLHQETAISKIQIWGNCKGQIAWILPHKFKEKKMEERDSVCEKIPKDTSNFKNEQDAHMQDNTIKCSKAITESRDLVTFAGEVGLLGGRISQCSPKKLNPKEIHICEDIYHRTWLT